VYKSVQEYICYSLEIQVDEYPSRIWTTEYSWYTLKSPVPEFAMFYRCCFSDKKGENARIGSLYCPFLYNSEKRPSTKLEKQKHETYNTGKAKS